MAKKNSGKYFLKNTSSGTYADVTTLFDGVSILSVSGFDGVGKALNVYAEQWIDSQTEDFLIAGNDGVIVRENVALTLVFICGQRYADATIDVQYVYDSFISYVTNTDFWVASTYFGKQVHCVAMDDAELKSIKLHRGGNSYILGEISLHTLEKPSAYPV